MAERFSVRPGITMRLMDLPRQFQVHTVAGFATLTRIIEPGDGHIRVEPFEQWEIETAFTRGPGAGRVISIHYGTPPWVSVEDALDGLNVLVARWVVADDHRAAEAMRDQRKDS